MNKVKQKQIGRPKGGIPWNKGLKGVYHLWPNGRVLSKKTRIKIGLAGKGRIPWNKNKPYLQIRGSKNPSWKGGITSNDQTLRSRIEFKNWKREVFLINPNLCSKCGSKKQLVAHHIKNFKTHKKLRYDPKNGMIVCRSCHCKIHKPKRKNYV